MTTRRGFIAACAGVAAAWVARPAAAETPQQHDRAAHVAERGQRAAGMPAQPRVPRAMRIERRIETACARVRRPFVLHRHHDAFARMFVEKTHAIGQHVVERHAERDTAVMNVERVAHVPAADVEQPHAMRELRIERRTLRAHERIVDRIRTGVMAAR